MANLEAQTLKLINAIPPITDSIDGMCPLAWDASGTKIECFEATALNEGVAESLQNGEKWVNYATRQELAYQARFRDPQRMAEYAACLITRASGNCPSYDAEAGRSRNEEETIQYIRSKKNG